MSSKTSVASSDKMISNHQDDDWTQKYTTDLYEALTASTPSIQRNQSTSTNKTASRKDIPRRPVSNSSERLPSRTPSAASGRPPSYRTIAAPGHASSSSSSSSSSPAVRSPATRTPAPKPPSSRSNRNNMSAPTSSRPEGERRPRHSQSVPRRSRHRRGASQPDTIDRLDTIGGGYHHDGPYEATLASRNVNKKYAPIDAVRESNMEAIRATPAAYIQDSLQRHVPLQGTSTVPSGFYDIGGKLMTYEEGTDMMRDPTAGGGAYKRWDFREYHPDDLKGKGEPSFTYDRLAAQKKERGLLGPDDNIEMQGRARSVSSGAYDGHTSGLEGHNKQTHGGRIGSGLKRRFGSLRRKDVQ